MQFLRKHDLFPRGLAGALSLLLSAQGLAQSPVSVKLDEHGSVHASGIVVPQSAYLTEQGRQAVIKGARDHAPFPTGPLSELMRPGPAVDAWRQAVDAYMEPRVAHLRSLYPVEVESKIIGGVRTDVVTPRAGYTAESRARVLINLHGGAHMIGGKFGGQGESIPVAALGRVKVIAVDYRLAPEHRFPAASIDVAAVYRALLKEYRPENIGIYGCSAGGRLTAQAVAWFQKEQLPRPGAIGILCGAANAAVDGDSNYLAPLLNGIKPPPPGGSALPKLIYLEGVDPNDPMVSPDRSPAVLAKFPPTLLITGTRDMEMSAALNTHNALVKVGVEADLHVWDGLGHGFFLAHPEIQESRDALDVIVRFFDKHLGRG